MYRYKAGMTSRDLARMKTGNRYENAPHIGRIVPAKRHAPAIDLSQHKTAAANMEKVLKEDEPKIKSYVSGEESKLVECDFKLLEIAKSVQEALGIHNMLTQKDLDKKKVDELFDSIPSTRPDS